MEDLQDPVPGGQDKSTFKSLFDDNGGSLILLATIFVVSLIVLVMAKTCMQVLGVIVVGSFGGDRHLHLPVQTPTSGPRSATKSLNERPRSAISGMRTGGAIATWP